ncbi:hypothetical protein DdX_06310 [Ditylenchus destructor]|uniref:Secreted protein n=1 Tax=Ditylenchus destructor TaxID=166010 RepID=A0AAD4R5L3_9BILA|nr:hypothetical protein DdX_06310 [Ditylenchus destructor]
MQAFSRLPGWPRRFFLLILPFHPLFVFEKEPGGGRFGKRTKLNFNFHHGKCCYQGAKEALGEDEPHVSSKRGQGHSRDLPT